MNAQRPTGLILIAAWMCLMFLGACSRNDPDSLVIESEPPAGRPASTADVQEFLGPSIVPIVTNPDRIVIHRIKDKKTEADSGAQLVGGYPLIRTSAELTADQRASWARLCLVPEGFADLDYHLRHPNLSRAKGCGFQPGLVVEFTKGTEHCLLTICLSCSEWRFRNPRDNVWRRDYFDAISGQIRSLARTSFPDDAALAPPVPKP